MADFKPALLELMVNEGGYVNDPNDLGGETYRGISRRSFQDWPGWRKIDDLRSNATFPRCLDADPEMQAAVQKFYLEQFWMPLGLGRIMHQPLANKLLDIAVSMGPDRMIRFLQRACRASGRYCVEDGALGPATFRAAAEASPFMLLAGVRVAAVDARLRDLHDRPENEPFRKGWIDRAYQ